MNTSYGASNNFGHADYYGNLNAGKTNKQILDWINNNQGMLHDDRYRPGELYSTIQAAAINDRNVAANKAQQKRQLAAQQAAIAKLQAGFDSRLSSVNDRMLAQQQSYASTLAEQKDRFNASQRQQQAQYASDILAMNNQFAETQSAQSARYTSDINAMKDTFSQRYSKQNQLYAGNLKSVRDELTAQQAQQAKKYQTNILNMQNTYASNQKKQEQKYASNILSMQNTFKEQQRQLRDTLNAKANPHTRQTQVGVQAPDAKEKAGAAKLQARGTKGSFNRQGLRIQALNI